MTTTALGSSTVVKGTVVSAARWRVLTPRRRPRAARWVGCGTWVVSGDRCALAAGGRVGCVRRWGGVLGWRGRAWSPVCT